MRLNNFHYGLFAVLLVALLGASNFDFSSLTGHQIVLSEDPCVNAEQLREEYYSLIENVNERLNKGEPVDLNEAERLEWKLIEEITSALKKCRNINENVAYALEVSDFLDLGEKAEPAKFVQQESIVGECPIIVENTIHSKIFEESIFAHKDLKKDIFFPDLRDPARGVTYYALGPDRDKVLFNEACSKARKIAEERFSCSCNGMLEATKSYEIIEQEKYEASEWLYSTELDGPGVGYYCKVKAECRCK